MSYSIMYDKQFIRSTQGITPAVMMGDNNVWTGSGKYQRRARSWSVIGNKLAVSEDQLLALAESWTGGPYQEHWKQNGQWVDDAALLRWMKNSIKSAATIEDIICANTFNSIQCCLSVWIGHNCSEELQTYVYSTEEFDLWAEQANARITEVMSLKENSAFPIVKFTDEFDNEKMNHLKLAKAVKPEKVVLKNKGKYLTEFTRYDNGQVNSTHWQRNVENALEMSYEEAVVFVNDFGGWSGRAQIVDSAIKLFPYNAVIKIVGYNDNGLYYDGKFVEKITSRRILFTQQKEWAYHYRNEKAANDAVKRLLPKLRGKSLGAEVIITQ